MAAQVWIQWKKKKKKKQRIISVQKNVDVVFKEFQMHSLFHFIFYVILNIGVWILQISIGKINFFLKNPSTVHKLQYNYTVIYDSL